MNLFKDLISESNSKNQPKTHSPIKHNRTTMANTPEQKPKKIKLMCIQQQAKLNELDQLTLIKAQNNSFIQRMSGRYEQLECNDIIKMLIEFAFKDFTNYNNKQDISKTKWCVVEVDEYNLKQKIVSTGICACSSITNQQRHQYNIINNIQLPSTIRPYCLVLNMEDKQLHFQSHQSSTNHFFINLDTVSVTLAQEKPINPELLIDQNFQRAVKILNQPLALRIQDINRPLQINIYLTSFTLPFPFKQTASKKQKVRYLLEIRQSLYLTLDKAINQSRGYQLKLRRNLNNALISSILYYNTRYATQQQFTKYCQSGDVLLFRDNHTFAKLQRAITNSPYDHVAVVFRSEQYGICLFQSNSSQGVGLISWRKLIRCNWYEGIEKIAWRKLQVHNRPADFQQKVDRFVKANLHKQFGISLPKLLKFKSDLCMKDSNRQYFCSELAADLYRSLGLLNEQKSGTQYWPKDFADGNGIQILNGSLDLQRELIFQPSILEQCYPGII